MNFILDISEYFFFHMTDVYVIFIIINLIIIGFMFLRPHLKRNSVVSEQSEQVWIVMKFMLYCYLITQSVEWENHLRDKQLDGYIEIVKASNNMVTIVFIAFLFYRRVGEKEIRMFLNILMRLLGKKSEIKGPKESK